MDCKWDYRLTEKANADLDEIVGYISIELANPKAASDFVDRLQQVIDKIREFPESSPLVSNEYLTKPNVRKQNVNNYIMYYLPDNDSKTIYVLRIVYGKRNMDEILNEI